MTKACSLLPLQGTCLSCPDGARPLSFHVQLRPLQPRAQGCPPEWPLLIKIPLPNPQDLCATHCLQDLGFDFFCKGKTTGEAGAGYLPNTVSENPEPSFSLATLLLMPSCHRRRFWDPSLRPPSQSVPAPSLLEETHLDSLVLDVEIARLPLGVNFS